MKTRLFQQIFLKISETLIRCAKESHVNVCVCGGGGGGGLLAFQRLHKSIFKMAASVDAFDVRILNFRLAITF